MRKCWELGCPRCCPSVPSPTGTRDRDQGLCPSCWGGEVGQGSPAGEVALSRAGITGAESVPGDAAGTELLWAPRTAVTPHLRGCCDPRPAVGLQELPQVPLQMFSTLMHFAFTAPHPSSCPRAALYLITSFIRYLSAKTTSISSCRALLSLLFISQSS